ncbi:hypothetical protein Ait01nite_021460 [Actinoplanes italicus]|nr:hypothetical protein Ait01nite_021460 [Actinoplanes italicus]
MFGRTGDSDSVPVPAPASAFGGATRAGGEALVAGRAPLRGSGLVAHPAAVSNDATTVRYPRVRKDMAAR